MVVGFPVSLCRLPSNPCLWRIPYLSPHSHFLLLIAFHVSLPILGPAVTTAFSLPSSRWHMIHWHTHSISFYLSRVYKHISSTRLHTAVWLCRLKQSLSSAFADALNIPISIFLRNRQFIIHVQKHSHTQSFLTLCPASSLLIWSVKLTEKMYRQSRWLHNDLLYLPYEHKGLPLCQRLRKL